MNARNAILRLCIVAALSALPAVPAVAACEDARQRLDVTLKGVEEYGRERERLDEELRRTLDADRRHEIEIHIREIDQTRMRLEEKARTLQRELKACESPSPLHPGIVAAIIGAIGAVLAALVGLLKRR
jgi:hypothetical protein